MQINGHCGTLYYGSFHDIHLLSQSVRWLLAYRLLSFHVVLAHHKLPHQLEIQMSRQAALKTITSSQRWGRVEIDGIWIRAPEIGWTRCMQLLYVPYHQPAMRWTYARSIMKASKQCVLCQPFLSRRLKKKHPASSSCSRSLAMAPTRVCDMRKTKDFSAWLQEERTSLKD